MKRTLYDILQVSNDADIGIIEVAYKKLKDDFKDAGDPESNNEMKLIQQAFAVLSDSTQRAMYDQSILALTSKAKILHYSDGMIDEVQKSNSGILRWGVVAVFVLVGLAVILNHSKSVKKINLDAEEAKQSAQNISKHMDNEEALITGTVGNQSKAVDNTAIIANRIVDLAQEREITQRIAMEKAAEERFKQQEVMRAHQLAAQRKQDDIRKTQQDILDSRQRDYEAELNRQKMMNQMIGLKEWGIARSFAKLSHEFSNIDRLEQAERQNSVIVIGNQPQPRLSNKSDYTIVIQGR